MVQVHSLKKKIEMLGSADFVVLNKFEKPRSEDALRDIKKQFRREKGMANSKFAHIGDEELNVFGTIASRFNDPGVNALFSAICESIRFKNIDMDSIGEVNKAPEKKGSIISPDRAFYILEKFPKRFELIMTKRRKMWITLKNMNLLKLLQN